MTDESKQAGKALNIKITEETHRKLRHLCAHADKTFAELLTVLIDREWAARSAEISRG